LKRYGNLFDVAFSKENLYAAYLDARKGKRKKRATFEFENNLGMNIQDLYDRTHNGTYVPDPYFKFIIHEPKERIIHAPSFRDVVLQHAIYRTIYDIFDRSFISTSFACRKGYGTYKTSDYVQKMMRQCDPDLYILKLDIRKFFYSIDRKVLRSLVERKIKDNKFVDVMMLFVKNEGDTGIPIGNLLSQIYALIYLNPLDHYVKRTLKIKRYARYVDDFVLIGLTRDSCISMRNVIENFILNKLRLTFSKTSIQKIKKGVNFVGYRTWRSKRFIRKHSLYKFSKAIRNRDIKAIVSIAGHAKRTASLPYMMRKIRSIAPELLNTLPNHYRLLAI